MLVMAAVMLLVMLAHDSDIEGNGDESGVDTDGSNIIINGETDGNRGGGRYSGVGSNLIRCSDKWWCR